jgi:hypothetical protein
VHAVTYAVAATAHNPFWIWTSKSVRDRWWLVIYDNKVVQCGESAYMDMAWILDLKSKVSDHISETYTRLVTLMTWSVVSNYLLHMILLACQIPTPEFRFPSSSILSPKIRFVVNAGSSNVLRTSENYTHVVVIPVPLSRRLSPAWRIQFFAVLR